MKKPSATRGRFHGRGDAPQAQMLQRSIPAHGSQETARRDIDQASDKRRLAVVRAGQRQVAVGQTASTHEQVLLAIATGSVKPGLLVASEGTQAEFAADGQMDGTDLVAGAGDVPLGKEVEQSRYDVANAPDVGAVIRDRALVANAP